LARWVVACATFSAGSKTSPRHAHAGRTGDPPVPRRQSLPRGPGPGRGRGPALLSFDTNMPGTIARGIVRARRGTARLLRSVEIAVFSRGLADRRTRYDHRAAGGNNVITRCSTCSSVAARVTPRRLSTVVVGNALTECLAGIPVRDRIAGNLALTTREIRDIGFAAAHPLQVREVRPGSVGREELRVCRRLAAANKPTAGDRVPPAQWVCVACSA
jgi:hypothetical protein